MLEYGIKAVTVNPTLITKATEIIRLVDSRNNQTRAFVLPLKYEPLIKQLVKDMEYKLWTKNKKKKLEQSSTKSDNLDTIMDLGIKSINSYLEHY